MRVYSSSNSGCCFNKSVKNKTYLMQQVKYLKQQKRKQHQHDNHNNNNELWLLPMERCCFFAFIFVTLFMQHYVVTVASAATNLANVERMIRGYGDGVTKGFKPHMRPSKIANIDILQAVPESLSKSQQRGHYRDNNDDVVGEKMALNSMEAIDNQTNISPAGKFEIRNVFGEPNYKSVNLTWEVEFVPSVQDTIVGNNSADVQPPTTFQIFFCEIQSFGPHRCRSKVVNDSNTLNVYDNTDNNLEVINKIRQMRQYITKIDNLRMATKYSFHIRSVPKNKNMKITGRSELFGNEVEGEEFLSNTMDQGQTIVIPTKGFSAQATRCLPTASEIEVETGPYFGGKIVVDGGNCGIKGDPNDAKDKYVMRIDHKICGSMVKPETNTVETFITVQENLGIFTHSTRRFVVVCSYQSGLQTVRASFSVPGHGGASAVQQDRSDEDERMGRGLKPMRYVDKSELVLKETTEEDISATTSKESQAMVQEMDNPTINYNKSAAEALRNIIPEVNEEHIKETESNETKQQNNPDYEENMKYDVSQNVELEKDSSVASTTTKDDDNEEGPDDQYQAAKEEEQEEYSAKFAKLTLDLTEQGIQTANTDDSEGDDIFESTPVGRGFGTGLELTSLNMASVILTALLSVILIGILIFVLYRETKLPAHIKHAPTITNCSSPCSLNESYRHHQHKYLQEMDNLHHDHPGLNIGIY